MCQRIFAELLSDAIGGANVYPRSRKPAPHRHRDRPRRCSVLGEDQGPGQEAALHQEGTRGESMDLSGVRPPPCGAGGFTADPLPDEVLAKILDQARFAPSGGNRQGWRVIVVRDAATKRALADLSAFAGRRYAAQAANGESPWNSIDPPRVDAATIERTPVPPRL